MDVDTDALRWFQQVADGVTVTEVADLERISQSGMSRALARLEREAGTPLLHRTGRTLHLTRAGATFKRHVDGLLHELDDGLAAVGQLLDPRTGTVAVAFQLSLGAWLVPALVARFRVENPEVRFELRQVRDELVVPALQDGTVDVELTTVHPTGTEVGWRPLLVEPLRLAVPSRRRATGAQRLGDYADVPFVTLRDTYDLRLRTEQLCAAAGFAPVIAFEGEDVTTVRGFVAAGLGVAVVPEPHAGVEADRSVRYLPIADDGAYRELGVAWPVERRLLPAAERFRQFVLDSTRGLFPALT
jgi:LysR family transcriptional activator of glutamate synthase operon